MYKLLFLDHWKEILKLYYSLSTVVDMEEALGRLAAEEFSSKYGFPKPDLTTALVTHCTKGGRATKAANLLKDMGYTNVEIYTGSLNDWNANNGPLEKD